MTDKDLARTNKEILRRYYARASGRRDDAADDRLAEFFHEDVELPANTLPHGRQGLEGLREHNRYMRTVLAGGPPTVEAMIAEGDKVAVRLTLRGRVIGELMGLRPSDKEFEIEEHMIFTFRNGKVSRVDRVADRYALVEQVGQGSISIG
ncbi:Predicted ester cyclase [Thermomonospora echinospora]|uniref:Predicted ester cyclase n=1 Tax=Thermomonospora echinospora TaxID=1992 RepID=A0A1H6D9D0_9ACTN|nr:ester cyclase [Thermomonospora echinospora]SEG81265.1 Predicted ester cyclase [Thermomonospora echinospora]